MKLRALVFASVLTAMLLVGTHTLMGTIRTGVFEAPPQQVAEPAPQQPIVIPYAAPLAQAPRMLVDDSAVSALQIENAALKERIQQLEQLRPTTRGELAVVLAVKESDLAHHLDRSELLPDAAKLADAVRAAGAANVWHALQAEARLYRSMADFKTKHPCVDKANRAMWHSAIWVPFYSRAITDVCDELYRLSLPSTVVESFRTRLTEGI